jgi:hypothetical protein
MNVLGKYMKIDELIENNNRFKKSEKLFNWIFIIIFFGIIIGNIIFITIVVKYYKKGNDPLFIFYTIVFLGFLFIYSLYNNWRIKRKQAKYNLLCPLCKKIFNQNIIPVVIATRNCPHCGKNILEEN